MNRPHDIVDSPERLRWLMNMARKALRPIEPPQHFELSVFWGYDEKDGRAAMYLAAWLNYRFGHGTVHGTHIRKFLASSEYASEEFEAEGAFLAAWSAAEIDSAQRRGPRLMGDIT